MFRIFLELSQVPLAQSLVGFWAVLSVFWLVRYLAERCKALAKRQAARSSTRQPLKTSQEQMRSFPILPWG